MFGGERVPLQVELVSAESRVWSGEARLVIARTTEGDIGVMPGHAPTLAILAPGQVTIRAAEGSDVTVDVEGGFLSIEHDRVMVLSDTAALASGGAPYGA
jgi:F-type H+-transporting ATPase subunit epsilon